MREGLTECSQRGADGFSTRTGSRPFHIARPSLRGEMDEVRATGSRRALST
jgi:hypothetical protein